ncbi:MAG: DUF4192 domain-containing protein [Dermatophilaceae bacterium]
MTTTIALRGPGDLVAFLPYHLGYHPTNSVVAVTVVGGVVGMVARVDIPDRCDLDDAAGSVVGPVLKQQPTEVTLVGYEDGDTRASAPLLLELTARLGGAKVQVVDALIVHAGRFASLLCSRACCAPRAGRPVPAPEDVPAVAEMVLVGRSPLSSRAALERAVEADRAVADEVAGVVRQRALLEDGLRRGRSASAWARLLGMSPGVAGPPTRRRAGDIADAALGLVDVPWRDGLVARLAPGFVPMSTVDPDVRALLDRRLPSWLDDKRSRDEVLARLLAMCRSLPDSCPAEATALCAVTAHLAWLGGDGALARAAVGRALRLTPDDRMTLLLLRLLDGAVPPPRPGAGQDGDLARSAPDAGRTG